jgi:DNA-binding NtrC family response regulator
MIKALVADDDKNLRKVLRLELSEEFEVGEADGGVKTLEMLESGEYDVLLLDLNMPGLSGIDVLKKIKDLENPIEVIILTGHGTVSTAVEAMKSGAYDFIMKPFKLDALKAIIKKAYEKKLLLHENLFLKTQIKRQSEIKKIITRSPLMLEILENVKRVAQSDFPVLICGDSGVGKELIARAIHESSQRTEGPFIPINCGAIPETMLESELFGYEKGAFTGAYAKKLGLLEIAHHGTLFLDEIGEMSLSLQGKLLRALETGKFFRIGGIKEVGVDVKIVAATNKDIKKEVEKSNFRGDLYYRISPLTINLPPLRERREDIPLLIEFTLKNNPAFKNKRFSKEALKILGRYDWPGNVRELNNVVHRALLLSQKDLIEPYDLPSDLTGDRKGPLSSRLVDIEKEHILKVLKEVEGHKSKAAELLGIDPKTLYRKLMSYGISE